MQMQSSESVETTQLYDGIGRYRRDDYRNRNHRALSRNYSRCRMPRTDATVALFG